MITALQRLCRPVAYAAIVIGAVWTVSSATALSGSPEAANALEKLRFASSMLVGGLLLAALAHWEEHNAGNRLDNVGD